MPEERPRRTQHSNEQRKNKSSGWQLIAVQSISCVVVILITLLFRVIGGSSFAQLRESFNKSIMSNSILATLAALIESPSKDSDDKTPGSDTTTEGSTTSANESTDEEGNGAGETTNSTKTGTTGTSSTGTGSAGTGTSQSSATSASKISAGTTKAAGGNDIPVTQRKVLYAPEGATFAPIKINRIAYKPLESGKITSIFGYRENPIGGGESFHQGLDIGAPQGSPIAAMYFGVVTEVGQSASYGNYVKIYHGNGIKVLYAHCSQILVNADAVIRAGEIVARVGSTGDSTGPHLHIEVILNGIAYDPAGVIQTKDYA